MLEYLDVESIELLTNNPKKGSGLRAFGVETEARIPHQLPSQLRGVRERRLDQRQRVNPAEPIC